MRTHPPGATGSAAEKAPLVRGPMLTAEVPLLRRYANVGCSNVSKLRRSIHALARQGTAGSLGSLDDRSRATLDFARSE